MIQLKKKYPDIIISTEVAGFARYVERSAFNPNNTRTAHLTDDPGKAQRFYTEYEANRHIEKFPKNLQYTTEPFAPAAVKNR